MTEGCRDAQGAAAGHQEQAVQVRTATSPGSGVQLHRGLLPLEGPGLGVRGVTEGHTQLKLASSLGLSTAILKTKGHLIQVTFLVCRPPLPSLLVLSPTSPSPGSTTTLTSFPLSGGHPVPLCCPRFLLAKGGCPPTVGKDDEKGDRAKPRHVRTMQGRLRTALSRDRPSAPHRGLRWGRGAARPAPSDWLRASRRRAAIGRRGCLARGRARWGGGAGSCWKSGGGAGAGAGADAGGRPGARARARAGTRARGRGRGHRGRAEPVTAPGPSLAPPRAAHTAGGQGAGAPAASPSSASPGTARGRAARAAGARQAERQAGHGHHQHHGLHPAAAPQQRRAAAHRPGTRGGPAGVAPSPPPPRRCAIRAGAGTPGTGCGWGRPLRGGGDPPVIVRTPSRASRPSPACPPSPHPGRARAARGGSGHRRARVHAWPCCPPQQRPEPGRVCAGHSAIRSPEATCSACGHGCRRCRKAVLWCLCPARVAPNAPRGSRMDGPQRRVH